MPGSTQEPRPYHSYEFVNRDQEVHEVRARLDALLDGRPVDKPIVVFRGEKGMGKSWLLRHIEQQIRTHEKDGQPSRHIVFPLVDLARFEAEDPLLALHTILDELLPALGQSVPDPYDLAAKVRLFSEGIHNKLREGPLILLVDTVYESNEKLLQRLEEDLLVPFARLAGGLLIMTGRGQPYVWRDVVLRGRKVQRKTLGPFDVSFTDEQLQKQCKLQPDQAASLSPEIHTITGGNPGVNFILGLEGLSNKIVAIDEAIQHMLGVIRDPLLRDQMRDYLEHLCVLQPGFDVDEVSALMGVPHGPSRSILRELAKVGFAHLIEDVVDDPSPDQHGYCIDETIRTLITHYVEAEKHKLWTTMHCEAKRFYESWQVRYSTAGSMYLSRIKHHAGYCPETSG